MNKYLLRAAAQQCALVNPFEMLKDSEGVQLVDLNNEQLKTVKA